MGQAGQAVFGKTRQVYRWGEGRFVTALVILFLALSGLSYAQDADYRELAEEEGLQLDPEALTADDDWREIAGVAPPEPRDEQFSLLQLLGFINWIQLVLFAAALAVIGVIVWLVIRYGGAIQLNFKEASEGQTGVELSEGSGPLLSSEEEISSLDAVLKIADLTVAIGALQRLMLEKSLEALDTRLRKSDTARAALARIPEGWPHRAAMAWLVRLTERVRYAGDLLDQDGLSEAVSAMRPVLTALERGR